MKTFTSILVGVAVIIAMAVLQAFQWPTQVVVSFGPLLVIIGTIYGVTPTATAALIRAKLSPHLYAVLAAVLSALAGLLPLVSVGSALRIVLGLVLAVGAVLLPGSQIPSAVAPTPAKPTPPQPVRPSPMVGETMEPAK